MQFLYDDGQFVHPPAPHLTAPYLRAETGLNDPREISVGLHPDFTAHHLPCPDSGVDRLDYYASGCRGNGAFVRWASAEELEAAAGAVPSISSYSRSTVTAAHMEIDHPHTNGLRIRVLDIMRFASIRGHSRAEGRLGNLAIDLWRLTKGANGRFWLLTTASIGAGAANKPKRV